MDLSVIAETGAANASIAGRKSIADNYDTFLNLLVSQLKHQDPLKPLDTNEFTQQLVQYASVEQQLQANENLEALQKLAAAQAALSAVGYLGARVSTSGAQTSLQNGQASWTYRIDGDAPTAKITIRNEAGATVYSRSTNLQSGRRAFTWDGGLSTGGKAPDGRYTITIEAQDSDGKAVQVSTEVTGRVQSVDLSGTEPMLMVNESAVPLSSVREVVAP
jgi:flagellar basal-body rod modification protein FlgD